MFVTLICERTLREHVDNDTKCIVNAGRTALGQLFTFTLRITHALVTNNCCTELLHGTVKVSDKPLRMHYSVKPRKLGSEGDIHFPIVRKAFVRRSCINYMYCEAVSALSLGWGSSAAQGRKNASDNNAAIHSYIQHTNAVPADYMHCIRNSSELVSLVLTVMMGISSTSLHINKRATKRCKLERLKSHKNSNLNLWSTMPAPAYICDNPKSKAQTYLSVNQLTTNL
uniref:Uncharacterized protein n=1 Tax=Glossina pallidipes TaxID=7398 RepID=A0A1B0ADG7_GLOPL